MYIVQNKTGGEMIHPSHPSDRQPSTSLILILSCLIIAYLVHYIIWIPQKEYFSEVVNYSSDRTIGINACRTVYEGKFNVESSRGHEKTPRNLFYRRWKIPMGDRVIIAIVFSAAFTGHIGRRRRWYRGLAVGLVTRGRGRGNGYTINRGRARTHADRWSSAYS